MGRKNVGTIRNPGRPDSCFENAALARGFARIAGVDEVGRGPLAGPVTAAAAVLDIARQPDDLNDSKKLTAKRREELGAVIRRTADVSVAHASVGEIDEIGILWATLLAMRRAIEGLSPAPDYVLIDGNRAPEGLKMPSQTIIRGDARSLSVAAASIVAKTARDRIMRNLAQRFPGYGWERNAGYPTATHREALRNLGATPCHRRSFSPVRAILYKEES